MQNKFIDNCEHTVFNKLSYIPSKLSNCISCDTSEFMLRKSPYNTSMFNICWLKNISTENLKDSVEKIVKFFSPHPFALWMGPSSEPKISEELLNKVGFIKEANEIGMGLNLSTFKPAEDINASDIFEVSNKEGMEHFIYVLEAYDPFVRDYYLKVLQELGVGKKHSYRFFYLLVNGKAACIASLFFYKDYCGIFDVLTHENSRKKGYAFRLMNYLLGYAKQEGSSYMCLTASSSEAVNLYKKMGFSNFGDYQCYEFKG